MSFNLFSDIVDLKYDLILLSVENDLSHLAVLTEIVSEICNNSNRHGKVSLSGTSSVTTSLIRYYIDIIYIIYYYIILLYIIIIYIIYYILYILYIIIYIILYRYYILSHVAIGEW